MISGFFSLMKKRILVCGPNLARGLWPKGAVAYLATQCNAGHEGEQVVARDPAMAQGGLASPCHLVRQSTRTVVTTAGADAVAQVAAASRTSRQARWPGRATMMDEELTGKGGGGGKLTEQRGDGEVVEGGRGDSVLRQRVAGSGLRWLGTIHVVRLG
jgi:hypothetical protein